MKLHSKENKLNKQINHLSKIAMTTHRFISNEELLEYFSQMQADIDQLRSQVGHLTQEERRVIVQNIPSQPIIVQQSPGYYGPSLYRVSRYPSIFGALPFLFGRRSIFRPSYRRSSSRGRFRGSGRKRRRF